MRPMSNDELTKHAIRTSADLLELTEKIDGIKNVQDVHTQRFDAIDERLDAHDKRFDAIDERLDAHGERLDNLETTLKAHVAVSEDFYRKTDANFLEIRDLLGNLIAKSGTAT